MDFMNVAGLPWSNLGTTYKTKVTKSEDLIRQAKLNYTVSSHRMGCDLADKMQGYHAIYRDDTNTLLGVVNNPYPAIIQNERSFSALEDMLEDDTLTIETVAPYKVGASVFGVFKLHNPYKLLDDDADMYYIVVNDHLKPDGKVQVLFTPVRIVCQNALSYAITKSLYSVRIPILETRSQMSYISSELIHASDNAMSYLNTKAQQMVSAKLKADAVDIILDEVFPFLPETDENAHERANDAVDAARTQFVDCLHADNLSNYSGTIYQIYNGVTDFAQHYFKDATKGFDLNHKISILPGIGVADPKVSLIKKVMMIAQENSIAA